MGGCTLAPTSGWAKLAIAGGVAAVLVAAAVAFVLLGREREPAAAGVACNSSHWSGLDEMRDRELLIAMRDRLAASAKKPLS